MKKTFRLLVTLLALFCVTPSFANNEYGSPEAQRIREAVSRFRQLPVDRDHARHGRRAFEAGLRFAKKHDIPYFVEKMPSGQKRIVMNVAGEDKIKAYMNIFSPRGRVNYMENFFSATSTSEPTWSQLRIGDQFWKKYTDPNLPSPRTYDPNLRAYDTRTAFPYSVTKEEFATRMNAIDTTPNAPFDYYGGITSGTAQNCTDWLTNVVGGLTGIVTGAVKHHGSALMDGKWISPRMTVKAVISSRPIPDFKNSPEVGPRTWQ